MARITVEDCLKKVNNRFALIHMVSKRVRQLRKGAESTISSKNRDIVVSLREIARGNIHPIGKDEADNLLKTQTAQVIEAGNLELDEKSHVDMED